ncbi:MAG: hypothetical protein ACKOCK_11010 [Chloroflexota bacterium]
MHDVLTQLIARLAAPMNRRAAGVALVGGAFAAMAGPGVATAKKRKKRHHGPITVCAVGCDYTELNDAALAAEPGSRICLKSGTYDGNVLITKSLTIKPCTAEDVVTIQPDGSNRAFDIQELTDTDTLKIRGFSAETFIINGAVAAASDGGVIRLGYDSTPVAGHLDLRNVTLRNGASLGWGGGIGAYTTGNVRLKHVVIRSCNANTSGGGIEMRYGTLQLEGATSVSFCNAEQGAGVTLRSGSSMTMSGTSVIGGTSLGDKNDAYISNGGGVFVASGCTLTMNDDAMVAYNKTQGSGGGIYAEAAATLAGNASCSNPHVVGNELYPNSTGAGPQIFKDGGASC